MQRGLALLLCALSVFVASCASQSSSQAKSERRAEQVAAQAAALHFLNLLDQGDYEEAFEFEAQDFRMFRTQQQFVRYMQARRAPFGRVLSRSTIGQRAIHKFVGVPEGNYQSMIFKTAFEHKSPTAERVVMVKQSNGWRVIDYRIY